MTRAALVTGVTGQDGSYLAEHLAAAGYHVYGTVRSLQHPRCDWIRYLVPSIKLVAADLLDRSSLEWALQVSCPDEVYSVAAATSPGGGWGSDASPLLGEVTGLGPVKLLEAVSSVTPTARVVHASSSATYDRTGRYGLYGAAKTLAHDAVVGFRERRGLHVSNAVLFSHTSPRQSSTFLIRRIAAHVAARAVGEDTDLKLTNLGNRRDWGYAPDYVRALHAIARADEPDDYDVLTGEDHSVRDAVDAALGAVGGTWDLVPEWQRIADVSVILEAGPPGGSKSVRELGWSPSLSFEQTVATLVEAA